jgi:hypothetical protein
VPEHGAEAARIVQAQHAPSLGPAHDQVEVVVLFQLDAVGSTRRWPDMPRWTIRVPCSNFSSRYLPRRPVQDAPALQQRRQLGRKRPAQTLAAQHDVFDDAAFQVRSDAAPGDFYFWEFRH